LNSDYIPLIADEMATEALLGLVAHSCATIVRESGLEPDIRASISTSTVSIELLARAEKQEMQLSRAARSR